MHLNHRRSFLRTAGTALTGMFGLPSLSKALQQTTSPYRRPKLKITDIKSAFLQGFHVRIYTDQGPHDRTPHDTDSPPNQVSIIGSHSWLQFRTGF